MTDFISAAAASIVQVSIGHPLDTAKVLIQNNRNWKALSLPQFYRGYRYPLISDIFFNCTAFPVYKRTEKYTNSKIISAFLSGICVFPIVFCFDTGKILRQTGQKVNIKEIVNRRGKFATFYRETLAMTCYFSSYEYLKNKEYHPIIAGGVAGLTSWTLTYPIDVIRSRQIAQQISFKRALNIGNLWKGYSFCAIRAILVNACIFYTYETVHAFSEEKLHLFE